jgi:hypothetical protein
LYFSSTPTTFSTKIESSRIQELLESPTTAAPGAWLLAETTIQ